MIFIEKMESPITFALSTSPVDLPNAMMTPVCPYHIVVRSLNGLPQARGLQ